MGNQNNPAGLAADGVKDPAMTYFRAESTIIGPKCLTAVFGMGTGVATWVYSPGYAKDHSDNSEGNGSHHTRTSESAGAEARKRKVWSSDRLLVSVS